MPDKTNFVNSIKKKKSFKVETQEDLVALQKAGKRTMTVDELFVDDTGEFSSLLQSIKVEMDTEAAIMDTYTNEIWEIINAKKQDNIKGVNRNKSIKEYCIERFADESKPLRILTKSDISGDRLERFFSRIDDVYKKTIREKPDSKKISQVVKDLAEQKIFGKGLIKNIYELVEKDKVEKYLEEEKVFKIGKTESVGKTTVRTIGWNELQSEANLFYKEILKKYQQSEELVVKHRPKLNSINELYPGKYKQKVNDFTKRGVLPKNINQLIKDNESNLDLLLKAKNMISLIDRYRDDGEKFDLAALEELRLRIEKKSAGGVKCVIAPFFDKKNPLVEFFNNKLGVVNEVYFEDNGNKSKESSRRKVSEPRFAGDAGGICDMVRNTFVYSKMSGSGYYFRCLEILCNQKGYSYYKENVEISPAFYYSRKMNIAYNVEYNGKTYVRIGESKGGIHNQIKDKPHAQVVFDARRVMYPEKQTNVRQFLDVNSDSVAREESYYLLQKAFNNIVVSIVSESRGIYLPQKEEFLKNQDIFKKTYFDMQFVERKIFLEALVDSHESIVRDAYFNIRKKMTKDEVNQKESYFKEQDLTMFGDLLKQSKGGEALLLRLEKDWSKIEIPYRKSLEIEKLIKPSGNSQASGLNK